MRALRRSRSALAAMAAGLILLNSPAGAHELSAGGAGLTAGFVHPFTGIDHVLAMVAVGAIAGIRGGDARIRIPVAFLGALMAGAVVALAGAAVPLFEPVIVASLLVIGCLAGAGARLGTQAVATIVAFFAFFHGLAHGVETPAGAGPLEYVVGFGFAATTLLALGSVAACSVPRLAGQLRRS